VIRLVLILANKEWRLKSKDFIRMNRLRTEEIRRQ
jgi:hypothetical protein